MGNFGGQCLPGGIGTDVVPHLSAQAEPAYDPVAASILLERVLGCMPIFCRAHCSCDHQVGVVASPKLSVIVLLPALYRPFRHQLRALLKAYSNMQKRFPHLRYLHKRLQA